MLWIGLIVGVVGYTYCLFPLLRTVEGFFGVFLVLGIPLSFFVTVMLAFLLPIKHKHTMVVRKFEMDTVNGKIKHSRFICEKCGWINYNHRLTTYKRSEDYM